MVAPKKELDKAAPDAEWWDRGVLPNQSYDDLDKQIDDNESALLGITNLIEHPIQKEPPGIFLSNIHILYISLSQFTFIFVFLNHYVFILLQPPLL